MLGWRARVGLLIPSNNTVIEPELCGMAPEGVTIHSTRLLVEGDSVEDMMSMTKQAINAAKLLSPVDVMGYACLSTSFYGGSDANEELIRRLQMDTGKPVTTAASSMVESLRHLGLQSPLVATPYEERVNVKLKQFLGQAGIEVASLVAFDPPPKPTEVCDIDVSKVYQLARQGVSEKIDGIFICATDLRSVDIISQLEYDTGKTVVSTNQALFWNLMRLSKIKFREERYGSLFK